MKKRMLSLIVTAILLLVSFVPTEALAAPGVENPSTEKEALNESQNYDDGAISFETDAAVYINPVYIDVITEDDINVPDKIESPGDYGNYGISMLAETPEYCDTVEEAGAVLRSGMVAREEAITVYYYGNTYSSDYFKDLCTNQIIPEAFVETINANEGDYLRYNYGGVGYRASIATDADGNYRYYTIVFTPTYFTTADQEAAVNEKVNELLETTFSFEKSDSDYKEIYTVYNYICSNVTYDNENLNDSTYTLKYSTYAALINGTAVCQGYASLCYRILRELGINVRVATGYGGETSEDASNYYENHAWNIVQIDSKWYYFDSTWDAGFSDEVAAGTYSYQYFLKGTLDFDSLESPYSTTGIHYLIMDENFTNTYSIEDTRYIPVKTLSAPSLKLDVAQNNGKIQLTGSVTDYENKDDYYEITSHGFVYITKTLLGAKTLTVNTVGRTKVSINGIGSNGRYRYSMTPKNSNTMYVIRAFVTYKNSAGKTVYVYSNTIYTSYNGING